VDLLNWKMSQNLLSAPLGRFERIYLYNLSGQNKNIEGRMDTLLLGELGCRNTTPQIVHRIPPDNSNNRRYTLPKIPPSTHNLPQKRNRINRLSSPLDKIDLKTYIKNEKEDAFFPRYEDIIDKVKTYNPSTNENLLKKAYLISGMAHDNVSRRDGTPYLSHPLSVVNILADLRMDDTGLVAGFLHDVVEDNQVVKIEKIRDLFGEEVALVIVKIGMSGPEGFGSLMYKKINWRSEN